MSRGRFVARSLAVAAVALATFAAHAQSPGNAQPRVSQLIVKFRASPDKALLSKDLRVAQLGADAGVHLEHAREMALGMDVVRLDAPRSIDDARVLAARVAASADVEFAEVDLPMRALLVPNDEFASAQNYLQNTPTGIGAYGAWDVTTGSPNVVVAVLDTGIRPHADLAGRIIPGYDFVSNPLRAGDGDGRDPDASDPGTFVTQADIDAGLTGVDCTPQPSAWHGTAVAGVIGADGNNHAWTAGIDWAAKIEPVRVLGKCGGSTSDIADAIIWASGLNVPGVPPNPYPAHVINLSLGGQGACPQAYALAINAALSTGNVRAIVAAAGNDGTAQISAPANCPHVISVVSTRTNGNLADYSNFGANATIAAPGGQPSSQIGGQGIITLWNAGTQQPGADAIVNIGGTSLAAPMVSGTAALVLSMAPDLTADQMRALLTSTAKPFPATSNCTTDICGAGIVDAGNAVRAIGGPPPAPNYEGLWWDSAESGWGINLAHQGDRIYLTWYTYDATGRPSWLAMLASKTGAGIYSGDVIELQGPAFNANPFAPTPTSNVVGTAALSFLDTNTGTFSYNVKSFSGVKEITRYPFAAPPPKCTYAASPDFASAANYEDLWWDSAENGWGINLAHQGTQVYATWYTYDTDGKPLWLASLMDQTTPGSFSGQLLRVSGSPFGAAWNRNLVIPTSVGTASLAFTNGNAGTWSYTVGNVSASKPITRYLFASPAGTVCR